VRRRVDFSDIAGGREGVTLGLLIITIVVCATLSPYFVGTLNASFILTNSVEIGLIALPMTMVMVMGEIDLSVGSIVGLCAAVLGESAAHGLPFVVGAALALGTGLVAGAINGLLCTTFRLPSLVVTLGTYALYRGITEVLLGPATVTNFPSWFVGWNTRYVVGFVTYPQVFWVVCTLVAGVLLHRSGFGRRVYFAGASPEAARFAGISVRRLKVTVFCATGLISAVAALILVSRLQSLDNTAGVGFELTVITAVLLGGTDFRGGRGTIVGSFLAVLLIGALEDGLEIIGVSAQTTIAVVGGLLIVSFLIDGGTRALRTTIARRRLKSRPPHGRSAEIDVVAGSQQEVPEERRALGFTP
jgi:rhamnose transport system permease protein